jgi:hypothetical protein
MNHLKEKLFLFSIFVLALLLRTYGLNWDQNQHLHPDERFLTMVSTTIKLPSSISQYFDTTSSPLNPYNYKDYQFFVYGTFPLFLTKIIAEILHLSDYNSIVLVGRFLSALFDSFNIITLYFLSKLIFKKLLYLPSILYTFCVLPLQLSHFFAVDTYLTFFILLTFTLLSYNLFVLAAIVFGLGLACKISAIYFVPIIGLFLIKKFKKIVYFLPIVFITFRIFQPYAFISLFKINPLFISNLKTLESFSSPSVWFPPAVQWLNRIPLLYSLQNIVIWGLGLPISLLLFFLLITKFKSICNIKKNYFVVLSLAWILLLYFYQGSQFSHNMRYFLPIYPFIFIILTYLLSLIKLPKIVFIIFFLNFIWSLSFLSIYSKPHSRVQASQWIYQNISSESSITNEYWDDPLPLSLIGHNPNQYRGAMLSLYDPDTPSKWQVINQQINQADYLFLTSNRLWASIPRVPQKYPQTSIFYNNLFDENLNFSRLNRFVSYPGFNLSFLSACYYLGPSNYPYKQKNNTWFEIDKNCNYKGIYFRDDLAEESFTVYDHPQVLIFKKK